MTPGNDYVKTLNTKGMHTHMHTDRHDDIHPWILCAVFNYHTIAPEVLYIIHNQLIQCYFFFLLEIGYFALVTMCL